MWWKKKKETIEHPQNWTIGKKSGYIFQSWDEVPYNIYLKFLKCTDHNSKLKLLTGADDEILKDDKLRAKWESMTIFCMSEPLVNDELHILLKDGFYSFDKEIDLLSHTYDQYAFVDTKLKPLYDLQNLLQEETAKDTPDPVIIAENTENQMFEMLKAYPDIIAAYANVGKGDTFNHNKVSTYTREIAETNTVKVLTLGSFFFDCSVRLKIGK